VPTFRQFEGSKAPRLGRRCGGGRFGFKSWFIHNIKMLIWTEKLIRRVSQTIVVKVQ